MDPFYGIKSRTILNGGFAYLITVLFSLSVQSQHIEYEFQLFEISDGLADNMVQKVVQDEAGFLWIATRNGLSRFDGHGFTNFSNFDTLQYIRRNKITDLHIDKDQLLYLGNDQGIDIFNTQTGLQKSILSNGNEPNGIKGTEIQSVWSDSNNRLWLSTPDKFSFQCSDDLVDFQYFEPLKSPDEFDYYNHLIYQFLENEDHIFARASQSQIWKMKKQGEVVKRYTLEGSVIRESLSSPYGMCFDNQGTLWAMFLANGVAYIDQKTDQLIRHPVSDLITEPWKTKIAVNQNDELWIGGINLLYKFNPELDSLENMSSQLVELAEDVQVIIMDLFVDRENILWIATNLGLIKVTEKINYFAHHFAGEPIRALAESNNGSLFVGKFYTVNILDPNTGKVEAFPITNFTEKGRRIFLMDPTSLIVSDSILWLRGLSSYNINTNTLIERQTASYFDYISLIDHTGKNWVGGYKLFSYFDDAVDSFIPFHLNKDDGLNVEELEISAMFQTSDHNIWLGTNQGLLLIDYETKDIKLLDGLDQSTLKKIEETKVNCFFEDSQDRLWIGTDGGGLFYIDRKNNDTRKYNVLQGLPSNYIYGILPEGDSSLWFSTGNGLSRFHFSNSIFTNYDEDDGLLNGTYQKYSYLKSSDGTMYFGGNKGLDAFHPKDILSPGNTDLESKIVLTKYSKYLERSHQKEEHIYELQNLNEIEIQFYERDLTLHFVLLNQTNSEKRLYSWRMLGYADEWSEASPMNQVNYESLPPGDYIFQVRASAGKSNWNKEYLSLNISKKQAWYKSAWFFVLLGMLFGVLVFFYQRNRYREKMKVKARTEMLRTKISHDLHDDVGGILTGLTMQSEILEMGAEGNSKEIATKIKHLGREALSRMRDTVWAMDANKDDVNSLFDRMKDHAEFTLSPSELSYDFDLVSDNQDQVLPPNIRQQTYLIYKEAITNAAKHSNGTWVKIEVSVHSNDLIMKIIDNGEVLHQKTSGVGIGSMKDRAASVKGDLKINANQGYRILFSVTW